MQFTVCKTPPRKASPSYMVRSRSNSRARSPSASCTSLYSSQIKHLSSRTKEEPEDWRHSLRESRLMSSGKQNPRSPKEHQKIDLSAIQRVLALDTTSRSPLDIPVEEKAPFCKCPYHLETYELYCTEDKNLYCMRCLYERKDASTSARKLLKMVPITNAIDNIIRENENFIKSEAVHYVNTLEKNLREFQRANNALSEKMTLYQSLVRDEFNEIRQYLDQREDELLQTVDKFYTKRIHDNLNHVNYLTLFRDTIQKIKQIHKLQDSDLALYQYNFAKSLRPCIEATGILDAHPKHDRAPVVDFVTKKRLLAEIEQFGKAVSKGLTEKYFGDTKEALHASGKRSKSPSLHETARVLSSGRKSDTFVKFREDSPMASFIRVTNASEGPSISHYHGTWKSTDFSARNDEFSGKLKKVTLLDSFFDDAQIFKESSILSGASCYQDMLETFPQKFEKATLLFSFAEHGCSSQIFHECCDDKGPCLVVAKTADNHIFGYYNPVGFKSEEGYLTTDKAWIFSLQNAIQKPLLFRIKPEKNFIAIHNSDKSPCLGSTIKAKEDLYIDLDNPSESRSTIGYAYKLPKSITNNGALLFGPEGSASIVELEVFQVQVEKK